MHIDLKALVTTGQDAPPISTEDELIAIHHQLVTGGERGEPRWLQAAQRVSRLLTWYCQCSTTEQFDIVDRCWFALVQALRQTPTSLAERSQQFVAVEGYLDHLGALVDRGTRGAPVQRTA